MTGEVLATNVREGRRMYGTLLTSTSPHWPPAVKNASLDFVFIDTEHIPIDRDTLSWMCRTYGGMGIPPLVRIPHPDAITACQVLDGGAWGIVAPYVETAAQVRELVGAVKRRPLKGAMLEQALDDPDSMDPSLRAYLDEFNAGKVLLANIESVPAMENLEAILAVPGLDGVLIGPHDLTVSLGIPEDYQHPRFEAAVREIITRARAAGRAAGIHFWENTHQEIAWAEAGATLLIHSGDITIFERTMREQLRTMRDALGDQPRGDAGGGATTV